MITLPEGFVARPLTAGDLESVTAVIAACEMDDDGVVDIGVEDIAAEWNRPEFDPALQSVGVFHGSVLAGVGEVYKSRSDTDVHPRWRGRGIGSALMRWTWEVTRALGGTEIGQTLPDIRTDAVALLTANGYEKRWTSWILQIALDERPEVPALPDGYALRDFTSADERAVYELIARAFGEFDQPQPTSFEAWQSTVANHEAFRAGASPLVVRDGRIAGVAIGFRYPGNDEGWVQQLAVQREHRGLGLGGILLRESFRRAYDAGWRKAGLSTDSRTGALGLYEHVGMKVRRSYTRYVKTLV